MMIVSAAVLSRTLLTIAVTATMITAAATLLGAAVMTAKLRAKQKKVCLIFMITLQNQQSSKRIKRVKEYEN
jgi:hypothetical protein